LPWQAPRHEKLLLVLVSLVVLTVVSAPNTQDVSRLCLSRAIVAGHLSNDHCLAGRTEDLSLYRGHLYSNKAPGLSVIEIVPAELVRLPDSRGWDYKGDLRLWLVRLLTSGLAFVVCVFLVGRVSEGLAPGYGGAVLVTFALGTQMSSLGVANFSHVPVAALGFGAFLLLWARRPLPAGLCAGLAVATEYDMAAVLLVLAAYVARLGKRPLAGYALGALPGVILVAAYDWAAFGAPWHNPLSYSDNSLRAQEDSGLLGIHAPTLHATGQVFLGDRGLLLVSPVSVLAAAGLVFLWRRGMRPEALVCAAVTVLFTAAECGYFTPYGGRAPGPRFLVAALPFLFLGLGPAFARWRTLATVLAGISILASLAVMLSWPEVAHYRDTVWGEIARVLTDRGSSRLAMSVPKIVLAWGVNRLVGAALVVLLAAAGCAVVVRDMRRPRAGLQDA
jgi:Glycosyltransferase family 87